MTDLRKYRLVRTSRVLAAGSFFALTPVLLDPTGFDPTPTAFVLWCAAWVSWLLTGVWAALGHMALDLMNGEPS